MVASTDIQGGPVKTQVRRKLFLLHGYTYVCAEPTVQVCGKYVYKEIQTVTEVNATCVLMKTGVAVLKNTMIYSMEEERVFKLTEYITTHSFVRIREPLKNEFPDAEKPPNCTISLLFQKFFNVSSIT